MGMDHMVKGREEEFEQIFASICDNYTIGSLIDVIEDIDVSGRGSDLDKTYWGGQIQPTEVCSMPFFRCIIDVEGNLAPCCMLPWPRRFGSVKENFYTVWNGKEHLSFLLDMLTDKNKYRVCSKCNVYAALIDKADYLDACRDNLIAKYTALLANAEQKNGAQV